MTTPIRRQYLRIKRQHPDAIVFFRLGDFYETFDDDARLTAQELEITLTAREMGKGSRVPMAGIPYHALENYLARLIARGHKVALCEQLSDPSKGKGLMEREVVRVVTPGTVVEPGLLEQKANNYLVALLTDEAEVGLAYADITTGEFVTSQLPRSRLAPELERLRPAELLLAEEADPPSSPYPHSLTRLDSHRFDPELAREALLDHFGVATLAGFGCDHLPLAVGAAGAILSYLGETQRGSLAQLSGLQTHTPETFMVLDASTRRNLELFEGLRSGSPSGSLLGLLDLTETAMGGRLLRRWLGQPLLDITALRQRQGAVSWFHENTGARLRLRELIHRLPDLERLINRVRGATATPREVVALRRGLEAVPAVREALGEGNDGPLVWLMAQLHPCHEVVDLIGRAIGDDPAPSSAEGGVIRPGFSAELDEIERGAKEARQFLAGLEQRERERLGIRSLKVGYNRVFGYYIEVTKPHLHLVPQDYIRKQTLSGAERFFTPQLKEYESRILIAEERRGELESALFRQVCAQVAASAERVLATASALAHLDVLAALAEAAVRNDYVRPELDEGEAIEIVDGRHPVVERALGEGEFVPNDTLLGKNETQLMVITGPNMSGKSTYLRQVALIVLMAQMGSFVPAKRARIGLVDRIFTRVGAQDDLAAGQSTFMVEMVETAHILHHASSRSLLVFDEIGRGTSTYDGISIARAVVEFIHNHPRLGAKTLFATHYHELVELARYLPRVGNFNVAVAEEGGEVVFLHRIVPGGADRSYGIHVAQLAGLPRPVVNRAREVLWELEGARRDGITSSGRRGRPRRKGIPAQQIPLFGLPSPLIDELKALDIASMTPLEAINKLYELQEKAKEG